MKRYIGTKIIMAKPMTRGNYNTYRGWEIPKNENPDDKGYFVKYPDGYESWSPESVFEEAYRECDNMTFGLAIEAMKKGYRVARKGWNGKGQYVRIVNPYTDKAYSVTEHEPIDGTLMAYIGMKTADNGFVPWIPSTGDMLAEDWGFVD